MSGSVLINGTEDNAAVRCNPADLVPETARPEMDRLVRMIAGKLRARLPSAYGIEMADLIQAGNVGLLQAAKTYEPARGAPLTGYAKFRIRGEMLDMVRRSAGRNRPPILTDFAEPADWEARLPASPDSSPQTGALRKQRLAIITEELQRLPEKDRVVVRLRYSSEMTLGQIGKILCVNESRACQIHQRALARLKRALWKRGVKRVSHL